MSKRSNNNVCDLSFETPFALQNHIEDVSEKVLSFSCDNCNYKTKTEEFLRLHIETMHINQENLYNEICDEEYYDRVIEPQIVSLLKEHGFDDSILNTEHDDIEYDDSLLKPEKNKRYFK